MKRLSNYLLFGITCAILCAPNHALGIKKLGQTGLKMLQIGVGARAAGMGESFIMVGDDANALFYNPAGIARMQSRFDFFANRTSWIADINYNAAAFVFNAGNWGSFGVSVISADYGEIIGTRVATTEAGFVETGTIEPGAIAAGISYARTLTDKFSVGGQIKYAYQDLGENLLANDKTVQNEVSGLAYDFGTIFYPGLGNLRLGIAITNFSKEFKYEQMPFQLPLTFKVGAAMDILPMFGMVLPGSSFLVSFDAIHPRDYTERIHLGGEFWFKNMLAVRAGHKFNYDEEGLTFGVGIKSPDIAGLKIKFDFAYGDFGAFESVNRISIGISY